MKHFRVLLVLVVAVIPKLTFGQVNPPPSLERNGDQVCAVKPDGSPGRCYRTAPSLGIQFANEVEYLYPHIQAYHRSLRISNQLPKGAEALEAVGGAILMQPQPVTMVVDQLRGLTVRNLAFDIAGTLPLADIPFAFTMDWKDRRGEGGTADVTGLIHVVDQIFAVDLGNIGEFRDRLVQNVIISSYSGPRMPLRATDGREVSADESIRTIVVPFLAGKFVSIGRIGFNRMEQRLQERLQEKVDKAAGSLGSEKPL